MKDKKKNTSISVNYIELTNDTCRQHHTFGNSKGITLVALVVTVVVLLILAGVTVNALISENGIIKQAQKAAFYTEVNNLKEQILILYSKENMFGSLEQYHLKPNNKFFIENGNLVFNAAKVSNQEKEWLKQLGVEEQSAFYLIMNEETKSQYNSVQSKGTYAEFVEIVNSRNI